VARVADVVLIEANKPFGTVVAAATQTIFPLHCQSPAVRVIDVIFVCVPVLRFTVLSATEDDIYSPTLPALALSADVVPTIPDVVEGVIVLVAWRVVNFPAPGVVVPMDGGDARYVENPVPLTVPDELRFVKAPVEGVELPIDPGEAKVAPPSVAALTDELQLNPTPDVQSKASFDALHDGTDCPDGVVAVRDPKSWFEDKAGRLE